MLNGLFVTCYHRLFNCVSTISKWYNIRCPKRTLIKSNKYSEDIKGEMFDFDTREFIGRVYLTNGSDWFGLTLLYITLHTK